MRNPSMDSLPALPGQCKLNRTSDFLLHDNGPLSDISGHDNITIPQGHQITTAELAGNSRVKQGQVTHFPRKRARVGFLDELSNGRGYPPLLQAALNDPDLTIENAGKSGETSSGGASRIGTVPSQYPSGPRAGNRCKATNVGTGGMSVEFNDCFHPNDEGYGSMHAGGSTRSVRPALWSKLSSWSCAAPHRPARLDTPEVKYFRDLVRRTALKTRAYLHI